VRLVYLESPYAPNPDNVQRVPVGRGACPCGRPFMPPGAISGAAGFRLYTSRTIAPLLCWTCALHQSLVQHVLYARDAMRDCLRRNEAPLASHLMYAASGILDDESPYQRETGIAAGLAWSCKADATVVYQDFGISRGMAEGIAAAAVAYRPIEYRNLEQKT
jgi:hypothetical protein